MGLTLLLWLLLVGKVICAPQDEPEPDTEPEPETEQYPDTEPEPDTETEPEQYPDTEPEPDTEIEPETESELYPETEPDPDAETDTENGPETVITTEPDEELTETPYDGTTTYSDETSDTESTSDYSEPTTTLHPFVELPQELECLNEGGVCAVYMTCPICMRGRPGLCPKAESARGPHYHQNDYNPDNDGAVCCYGRPVKETRCWKRMGSCVPSTAFCPSKRIFVDATDCEPGTKCCMASVIDHMILLEDS